MAPELLRARLSLSALACLIALGSAACSSQTVVPDEDRARIERELPGKTFYLRHSMYLGAFWNDHHKRFLVDTAPDDRPWVADPSGKTLPPAAPYLIVPAGTRVRLRKLELPTAFNIATRTAISPRHYPWLLVEVEGVPSEPAPTLVLRDSLRTYDELLEEIGRYLSPDDLAGALGVIQPELLAAIKEKRLVEGMTADLVSMAWGHPERKNLQPTPAGRKEEWSWGGGKRTATLLDGHLQSFTGEGAKLGPPPTY